MNNDKKKSNRHKGDKEKMTRSECASLGGLARAKALSRKRRVEIAKQGAQTRLENSTPKQRSLQASRAAQDRWMKWRKNNAASKKSESGN